MFVKTLALALATVCLTVPAGTSAQAAPDNYSPKRGVTFNSPVGDAATKRAIYRKIMRSINSSPRGSDINIFSWNFLTGEGTDSLLRAQRRGVRVRLLMDDRNLTLIDNPPYRRLKAGLRKGNRDRRAERRSWARVCHRSCRGNTGSAHSKFFMFSEAGRARRVVMQGSANLTLASTNNQWNDIYTYVGNRQVWDFTNRIFREATRDRPADRPYASLEMGRDRFIMYPISGRRSVDPVARLLNQVTCRGATNTASGRTVIRIAPDAVRQDRGMALARKVRDLWNRGCDVKIGYTVMGIQVGRMLRSQAGRGPVPMRHLVQDFDGDGEFDNYFHLKSMSIVGNVGGDRSGHVVLNGSANWSSLAKVSDENVGVYWRKSLTRRYANHINYWYNNFPSDGQNRLVFGSNRNAVYENGEPVSDGDLNPFARMTMD